MELCTECSINLSRAAAPSAAYSAPDESAAAGAHHCPSRPHQQRGARSSGSDHHHPRHQAHRDEGSDGANGDAHGGGATCLDDAHRALERLGSMIRQQQQQTVAMVTTGDDSSRAARPPPRLSQGRPRDQDGPPRAKMMPEVAEVGGVMGTYDAGEAPPGLSPAPKRQKTTVRHHISKANDDDDVIGRDGADYSSSALLDERHHHESPEGGGGGDEGDEEVPGRSAEVMDGGQSTAAAAIIGSSRDDRGTYSPPHSPTTGPCDCPGGDVGELEVRWPII